jgi:uncharacterized membrane protein (DUF485 family)
MDKQLLKMDINPSYREWLLERQRKFRQDAIIIGIVLYGITFILIYFFGILKKG